jgi:hypothetical protein
VDEAFSAFVAKKGKVKPGRWRAYGHKAPFHLWENLQTKWRDLRLALGKPKPGTSPAIQQEQNLNRRYRHLLQARPRLAIATRAAHIFLSREAQDARTR